MFLPSGVEYYNVFTTWNQKKIDNSQYSVRHPSQAIAAFDHLTSENKIFLSIISALPCLHKSDHYSAAMFYIPWIVIIVMGNPSITRELNLTEDIGPSISLFIGHSITIPSIP
ncbi:hypothetical protein LOAG_00366 [Loa loa]|uniref:Uncharacterized protein n=1 Tax=Loa loa TaxID=7209 RepID=A0A1S0UBE5_LOALO|nr:hypothetical protein LOAG_00366 [Loa loa]EFO28107.1 hypothetical protein LOAG_00366 [Loa loa]